MSKWHDRLTSVIGTCLVSYYVHVPHAGSGGCKNRPVPFPGRMSYKATKPGLVSVLYLSMRYNYGIVVY